MKIKYNICSVLSTVFKICLCNKNGHEDVWFDVWRSGSNLGSSSAGWAVLHKEIPLLWISVFSSVKWEWLYCYRPYRIAGKTYEDKSFWTQYVKVKHSWMWAVIFYNRDTQHPCMNEGPRIWLALPLGTLQAACLEAEPHDQIAAEQPHAVLQYLSLTASPTERCPFQPGGTHSALFWAAFLLILPGHQGLSKQAAWEGIN